MPRNLQSVGRSRSKLKSTRKPLRELNHTPVNKKHNVNSISQNPCLPISQIEEERDGDDSLDRLLLVHSDLSSLLHQIDDLVGKALRLKVTSKNDRKEIESFTHVLSEMQKSLQPWVPRFQQSFASSSLESDNQVENSLSGKTVDVVANDYKSKVVEIPDRSNWDLLVSPSPLVSWRASCNNEVGRQLFLLTPIPKCAKHRGLSKPAIQNSRTSTTVIVGQHPPPSPFAILEDLKNDLVEGVVAQPSPIKVSDSNVTSTETTLESKFKSPEKNSKTGCCTFAMTPRREVSPPKSCILLEPISEFTHKKIRGVRAATPYPTGVHNFSESDDSDSPSVEASEHLISRYPEVVGIKLAHEFGNGRKVVEASPVWCMSPPKTCIVMEPPEEEVLNTTTSLQFPTTVCAPCGKTTKESEYQGLGDGLAVIHRTPIWKEPESTIRTGKRPGENTLKKELWTKFEAATTHGLRFSEPVSQDAANRGFLDLLEEVSSDEEADTAAQVNR